MNGFSMVEIKSTTQPNYMNFELPNILSKSLVGNSLTVKTNQPTNVVVFACDTGTETYTSKVIKRSNIMSTNHSIQLENITNKDIYIGVITKINNQF